ncbi:Rgp1-domain-containing protein [Lentinus tigrinus ALCF2SS1-6]|uniref:Rgp1-domain-containing protein n=1 Tax=Lentinus tigrinus ALCF2SS1-6 TaxID=1328759 RepID=A0A5C2S4J2_9APHY|nr:Rgp1-domain-containing protein [Lentinus tigrinus ALCF2SS1-6]
MAGPASPAVDEAIRVVVTPSQASYFAGEPFSVSITLTNTRTPEAPVAAPRSSSHAHRRGAHSISSVPLSRPPTSPGTPRTVVPLFLPRSNNGAGSSTLRKGLIGRSLSKSSDEPPSAEVLRKRLLASRSLSATLSPSDLPTLNESDVPTSPATRLPASGNGDAPVPGTPSPRIVAPLARSPSLPPNHPHARKQSVMDGQLQLQDLRPPSSMSPFAPSPNASMSTFSLSLDPIAEAGSTSPDAPATPYIPSPVPETDMPNVRTQIPSGPTNASITKKPNGQLYPPANPRGPPHRPSQLGLGHGPPPAASSATHLKPPRSAFSSTFPAPNTELILYAYAQLLGTLTISPLEDAPSSPDQARNLNRLRARLLNPKAIGGGSMDITSSVGAPVLPTTGAGRRGSHARSSSLSAGLLSIISPTSAAPAPSSQPFVPGHRARTASVFSLFGNGQGPPASKSAVGLGLSTTNVDEEEVDPDTPLPTLDIQPSMLAVDLSLAPGESRTYTYSLTLPENLPPTFRGRALKFSYQFTLGICRSGGSVPGASPTSNSRVMKVPIRVYNNVAVGRPLSPYNLLWPVVSRRGPIPPGKVTEGSKESPKSTIPRAVPTLAPNLGTYEDLQEYSRNLLASFPDPKATGVRIKLPIESIPSTSNADLDSELERDMDNPTGCREAVEVLTRNPKKASYDVNKDGVKVAVLTFPKSAYRLGETILGVVELNDRPHRARVLKLSAMLEAHESLPSAIASPTMSRHLRRVHAEHHSCFMPATLRTTFSLDIPPDASPAFETTFDESSIGGVDRINLRKPKSSPGGLEWKVRLCLLVAIASPNAREGPEGGRTRHLVRDGSRGQWGSSWKAAQTIAPLERPLPVSATASPTTPNANGQLAPPTPSAALSWMSYFASSLLGPANAGYHDGDEDLEDADEETEDEIGAEEAWREVKVEMVECEVPVKVWPGNTAFKATEVVFDV